MMIRARPSPPATPTAEQPRCGVARGPGRPSGLFWMVASELIAGGIGFVVIVHLARRLGPPAFARVEYAAAVAAWLLVVVRGGVDVIVIREAARRPRLVRPLTDILIGLRCVAAIVGYAMVLAMAALLGVGSSRVDLQACKLEYSIVSPK